MTIPFTFNYTKELAVPKSMAISCPSRDNMFWKNFIRKSRIGCAQEIRYILQFHELYALAFALFYFYVFLRKRLIAYHHAPGNAQQICLGELLARTHFLPVIVPYLNAGVLQLLVGRLCFLGPVRYLKKMHQKWCHGLGPNNASLVMRCFYDSSHQ